MTHPSDPSRGLLARLRNYLLTQPLRRVDAETREHLDSAGDGRLDVKVIVVFITAAVSLTLIQYIAKAGHAGQDRLASLLDWVGLHTLAAQLPTATTPSTDRQFSDLVFFAVGCIIAYFVLPAMIIKLAFRERLCDYGLKFRGMFQDVWVYGLMLLLVVPVVVTVSFTAPFQASYPFYRLSPGESFWPRLIAWELLYALQFVALEFFFRGFLLHGARRRFGFYSIFAMMVPYCMIHFGKPMAETFAAIAAGIVLGIMSLKTRSICMGAVLHILIAWLMDVLSLWRQGLLF